MKKTAKYVSPNDHLAALPLRDWPAPALLAECMRAAGLWSAEPAFNSGGPLDDIEARAQEIAVRVLGYMKKKPADDAINQVTFFYRAAEYCKSGIKQSCYYIKTVSSDSGGDVEVSDDESELEYHKQDIGDAEVAEIESGGDELKTLMHKIGVTTLDHSMFDCTAKEWEAATGYRGRSFRGMKRKRKAAIAALLAQHCPGRFFGMTPPTGDEEIEPRRPAVRMFYCSDLGGLFGVDEFFPKPGALRFHWVWAEGGIDEYEARELEPGGIWTYKCRVRVESSPVMDAQKVLDAFLLCAA